MQHELIPLLYRGVAPVEGHGWQIRISRSALCRLRRVSPNLALGEPQWLYRRHVQRNCLQSASCVATSPNLPPDRGWGVWSNGGGGGVTWRGGPNLGVTFKTDLASRSGPPSHVQPSPLRPRCPPDFHNLLPAGQAGTPPTIPLAQCRSRSWVAGARHGAVGHHIPFDGLGCFHAHGTAPNHLARVPIFSFFRARGG